MAVSYGLSGECGDAHGPVYRPVLPVQTSRRSGTAAAFDAACPHPLRALAFGTRCRGAGDQGRQQGAHAASAGAEDREPQIDALAVPFRGGDEL